MAPTFTLRRARVEDAPGLTDVIRSIGWFSTIQGQERDDTLTQVLHQLERCLANDDHSVYVAVGKDVAVGAAGEILGYVSVHWEHYLIHSGPDGYISELFLKEAVRGQGIGAALLDLVKAEALQRGCPRLMLLNIRQRESYQRGFYVKHGWEEWTDAAPFVIKPGKER